MRDSVLDMHGMVVWLLMIKFQNSFFSYLCIDRTELMMEPTARERKNETSKRNRMCCSASRRDSISVSSPNHDVIRSCTFKERGHFMFALLNKHQSPWSVIVVENLSARQPRISTRHLYSFWDLSVWWGSSSVTGPIRISLMNASSGSMSIHLRTSRTRLLPKLSWIFTKSRFEGTTDIDGSVTMKTASMKRVSLVNRRIRVMLRIQIFNLFFLHQSDEQHWASQ